MLDWLNGWKRARNTSSLSGPLIVGMVWYASARPGPMNTTNLSFLFYDMTRIFWSIYSVRNKIRRIFFSLALFSILWPTSSLKEDTSRNDGLRSCARTQQRGSTKPLKNTVGASLVQSLFLFFPRSSSYISKTEMDLISRRSSSFVS